MLLFHFSGAGFKTGNYTGQQRERIKYMAISDRRQPLQIEHLYYNPFNKARNINITNLSNPVYFLQLNSPNWV